MTSHVLRVKPPAVEATPDLGQNLLLQREALSRAGCERICEDTASGSREARPGLERALEMLRAGDTLVVWKLDRLGRSVNQLVDLMSRLKAQGVQFNCLMDGIDTAALEGRSFYGVMASLAQMERALLVERTKAGLAAAKKQGRRGGRRRKMTDSKLEAARRLLAAGMPPKDVARDLGVSVPTLYRWLPASGKERRLKEWGGSAITSVGSE